MIFLKTIDKNLAKCVIKIIKIYQKTISPDHSPLRSTAPFTGCKFYPSCSEYGIQTFQKKGFFLGILPTIWRIVRCHPWSHGGVDMP